MTLKKKKKTFLKSKYALSFTIIPLSQIAFHILIDIILLSFFIIQMLIFFLHVKVAFANESRTSCPTVIFIPCLPL